VGKGYKISRYIHSPGLHDVYRLARSQPYRERRRSLKLREEVRNDDQVHLSIRVVEANPTASEMTARISFRLSGRIAEDAVTPAVEVTVVLNTIRGPQFVDFPKVDASIQFSLSFLSTGMLIGIPSTATTPIYGSS